MSGAQGFITGFANALSGQIQKKQDQQDQIDQMGLRFRLEGLAKDKADWQKKSEEEQQRIDAAKFISQKVGDPSFAPEALGWLKNNYSPQDIITMWNKGNFKKQAPAETTIKVDNPDVTANRMNQNIALPKGVMPQPDNSAFQSPEAGQVLSNVAGNEGNTPVMNTNPSNITQNSQFIPSSTQVQTDPKFNELNKYDKRVDEVAPGLSNYREANPMPKLPENVMSSDSLFKYIPDQVEQKIQSYEVEYLELQRALKANDKVKIEAQKQKLDAKEQSLKVKAEIDNKAKGIPVDYTAIVDKNGKYIKTVYTIRGPNGEILNAAQNPKTGKNEPVTVTPGMHLQPIDKDINNKIIDLHKEFRKSASDYNISSQSVAESFDLASRINNLLDKPEYLDRDGKSLLTTKTAGVLGVVNNALTEVQAIQKLIDNQTMTAQKAMDSNNPAEQSSAISALESSVKSLETKADSLMKGGVLSDRNAALALDKTLYTNYMTLMAYKLAQSNGQTSNGQSNKDVVRFQEMLGTTSSDSRAVKASLTQVLQMQKIKIDSQKKALDQNYSDVGADVGMDLGLTGQPLGELIINPQAKKFYDQIDKTATDNAAYTQQNYDQNLAAKQAQVPGQTPAETDTTPVEIEIKGRKVMSNTPYKTPSGKMGHFTSTGAFVYDQ